MENIETLLAAVAQTQGFDDDEPSSTVSASASPPKLGFENQLSRPSISAPVVNQTPATAITGGEKRKRGRPPRGAATTEPPPAKRKKQEDEEEDVCFICFDGGTLVLCDRKGCPKAYHPACIKRDEAFFKSKAKWNCGWHICSVCRKASHYMCYTCTYSLCRGCTRSADYVSVRGNKGFCPTCMKTIMLIENKDHAANEGVQVDFDDKGSWEYLFKVYWVILKEKLSLTLSELTQSKKPWKGTAAGYCSPQHHTMVDKRTTISYRSIEPLELNKPPVDIPQNNGLKTEPSGVYNHVEELNKKKGEDGINLNDDTEMPSMKNIAEAKKWDRANGEFGFKEVIDKPGCENDGDNHVILRNGSEACISSDIKLGDLSKPENDVSASWASKDLLEFVAHMRNGDMSAHSQFNVQQLLIDYIKRNNLRDPHQKSQIICDLRLRNLFGKPRVGHIEMLKLLEYHFLTSDDSQNSSFIPAGFVGSTASRMEVDGNSFGLTTPNNNRKRKASKKSEGRAPTIDLNEYAAIDVHNINLIFLRRNLVENLVQDQENFSGKVVGSIVRIRVSSNDQKQDVYRLVQVVGTTKVKEPYKIGEKTTDVMLEVLNLNKKEIVSIDAISNQDYTEEECRRLRQSIRCELVKHFTVGEILDKAMALQPVRVDDWLDTETSRLNHLRDRASEKGHKKELRECVEKLQILKSPEERLRRVSEIPVVHADPKMNPTYESEEDTGIDKYPVRSCSEFSRYGRKSISLKRKAKEAGSIQMQNRVLEKTDVSGSHYSDKNMNQVNNMNSFTGGKSKNAMQGSGLMITNSKGNSASAHTIETEKLWHYRDPNGKIQGPFSMMQLRKWSMTGLFPPNMRIWTNHEQYDSLLLVDALNGKFHGAPEFSLNSSSNSEETAKKCRENESIDATIGDNKQAETAPHDNTITENQRANESGSSSRPHCIDLMKDINTNVDDDARACAKLPYSSLQDSNVVIPDSSQKGNKLNHDSQSGEEKISTKKLMTSGHEPHNQNNNHDRVGLSSEEKLRPLLIDLISDPVECESATTPVKSPDSRKRDADVGAATLKTGDEHCGVETIWKHQNASANVAAQNTVVLELLSPTPRSNSEDHVDHPTPPKQSGLVSDFPLPDSGPSWAPTSNPAVQGLQISEIADEWCGYSPTPARPSSVQEFMSEILTANLSPNPHQLAAHGSPSHPPQSSNLPNWLSNINEPIEFDALGEESVSDLLAEVDAMESRGLASPTSAMKFARDLFQDCKDDCFSSIEDFSPTPTHGPVRSDAFSSTGVTSQSSIPCKPINLSQPPDALDSTFRRSMGHSSASSEGENNNAPTAFSSEAGSEFHPPQQINVNQETIGVNITPDNMEPGWGMVQGNINLVTVQGNVNLVLGGPTQGMANLGWGANPGPANWVNPNINRSPINLSLPWDGQRKYGGERYTSPREWGVYQGSGDHGRARPPPWGRQPYGGGGGGGGGGGYSRTPKGQRVCKFYESGHCKKGAFCDYLHP